MTAPNTQGVGNVPVIGQWIKFGAAIGHALFPGGDPRQQSFNFGQLIASQLPGILPPGSRPPPPSSSPPPPSSSPPPPMGGPAPPPIYTPPPSTSSPADTVQPLATQSSWAPWLFMYGRGPLKRGRKRKKKKREGQSPFLPRSPADVERQILDRVPKMPPGQWDDMVQGFVGSIPEAAPQVLPRVLPEILVGAARVVLGGVGAIFFPSRTADDDVWQPQPQPMPQPSGPRRRYRNKRPQPYAWPLPDFQGKWFPYDIPGAVVRVDPRVFGDPWEFPAPRDLPAPAPLPMPAPVPAPRPTTTPRPTTAPTPTKSPWPDPWTLLPFLTQPGTAPRRYRLPRNPSQPDPLTPPQTGPLPFESPFAQPFNRADQCQCEKPRKRKSDSCTNPVSSKRTFTRGGVKFRTITRKLTCQA